MSRHSPLVLAQLGCGYWGPNLARNFASLPYCELRYVAPHDISIIQYWLDDAEPTTVLRQGMDFIQQGVDDVAFLTLTYPNKVIANIHVSWLDPQKVRKMTVVGSRKMVVYDDVAEDKIAICDKGIDRKAVLGEHMDFDQ